MNLDSDKLLVDNLEQTIVHFPSFSRVQGETEVPLSFCQLSGSGRQAGGQLKGGLLTCEAWAGAILVKAAVVVCVRAV